MYRGASYIQHERKMRLFTWSEDGDRIYTDIDYEPYFYYETPKKELKDGVSLYGTMVRKISCRNEKDRRCKVDDIKTKRIYENIKPVQQFLLDRFWKVNETPEFSKFPLKVWFFDIEVYSPGGWVMPEDATAPINVITIYDSIEDHYYTWGLGKYVPTKENVTYVECKTESSLLENFLHFYCKDVPDVLSGYNSSGYDIPYMVNRITKVLGEEYTRKLSPMEDVLKNPIYARTAFDRFGKETTEYKIEGIAHLDYLLVYKKFSIGERENYKLDTIGEFEGVGNKIDIGESDLVKLADTDWQKFVDYNIQDVALLHKMESKLRYIQLARMLGYTGCTLFPDALGTLAVVSGAAVVQARNERVPKIVPTFVKDIDSGRQFAGGFVGHPQKGIQRDIISFDANSLYPSTMITLNLSPETKIGKIILQDSEEVVIRTVNHKEFKFSKDNFKKWLEKEKVAVAMNDCLFSQKKKGILAKICDRLYKVRKTKKKEAQKKKKELNKMSEDHVDYESIKREQEYLDIYQYTLKIALNSIYGACGNKHFSMFDIDIAEAITLTGQNVIKKSNEILKDFIKERLGVKKLDHDPIIFNDTDSCGITISSILRHENQSIYDGEDTSKVSPFVYKLENEIQDYLNTNIEKWSVERLNTTDCRFFFKREKICDKAMFIEKKNYIFHVLDLEGDPINDFTYTGGQLKKASMPKIVKSRVKDIVEHMILVEDEESSNELCDKLYEEFKNLSVEEIALGTSVKTMDKYTKGASLFHQNKGTPYGVKAAIYYNELLKRFKLEDKYEKITADDRIKIYYVEQPNKYGCKNFAFKYSCPKEFKEVFPVDHEKMFNTIAYSVLESFYNCVGWRPYKPNSAYKVNLHDLFGVESLT